MIENVDAFNFLVILVPVILLVSVVVYSRGLKSKQRIIQQQYVIEVIRYQNQIELFEARAQVEEREKERIARNLHDEINPVLTVLSQNLEKHRFAILKNKFELTSFEIDHTLIFKISEGIRSCCYELVPSFLTRFGLTKALENYLRPLGHEKLNVTFEVLKGSRGEELISKADQLNIYRMVLETINNLMKHAKCSELNFLVHISETVLTITILHNGIIVDNQQVDQLTAQSKGLGLKSLKARSLLLNATINYTRQSDYALINLTIPIKHE